MTQHTLEYLLDEMARFGDPRLSRFDGKTWYCSLDVFITGKGVEFKIKSEINHPTHLEAANVCYERMQDALNKISEGRLSPPKVKLVGVD